MLIQHGKKGNGVQANDELNMNADANQQRNAPLITFLMPCYNSASFMRRGVESLLKIEHSCEILLVNDGSSDETSAIAHEYADRYDHVIAVDQENSNWGGVVNRGISMAQGTYFKVIDSDDSFDQQALNRVLETLKQAVETGNEPDLLITNYVYDHKASGTQREMQYRSFFPVDRLFTWDEMGRPGLDKFIMIHAAWYKTSILRESGVVLPTKVSYMDSLLLLHPMPFVETLYYLDVAPYRYLIGREGQSVEIDVVKKHIDEQILATKLAIDDVDYGELLQAQPNCGMLMLGYVSCMMSVSTIHLFMINTPESLKKNDELWDYMREKNPVLYDHVRRSWAGRANRKTALGRRVARAGFAIAQKLY